MRDRGEDETADVDEEAVEAETAVDEEAVDAETAVDEEAVDALPPGPTSARTKDSELPSPTRAEWLWNALGWVAASAAWLLLATSTFLLARLPPAATPLSDHGWPANASELLAVAIDDGGRGDSAWVVLRVPTSADTFCHVDLSTGDATGCAPLGDEHGRTTSPDGELIDAGPRAERLAFHRASDGWLVAAQLDQGHLERAGLQLAPVRLVHLSDEGMRIAKDIDSDALGLTHLRLLHIDAIADAGRERAVVWLAGLSREGARSQIVRVDFDADYRAMSLDRYQLSEMGAADAFLSGEAVRTNSDPHAEPRLLARTIGGKLLELERGSAPRPRGACPSLSPCASNSSTLGYRQYTWNGRTTVVTGDELHAPKELAPENATTVLIAHDGGPVVAAYRLRRGDDEVTIVGQYSGAEPLILRGHGSGLEWLLVAEHASPGVSDVVGLARSIDPAPRPMVIPIAGGTEGQLIFSLGPSGWLVSVDAALQPRHRPPLTERLASFARRRWDFDPVSTAIFVIGLALGPLIGAFAFWAGRQNRRHRLRPSLAALWAYACPVLFLFIAKGRYLFPMVG